jgi:hypothetical protein
MPSSPRKHPGGVRKAAEPRAERGSLRMTSEVRKHADRLRRKWSLDSDSDLWERLIKSSARHTPHLNPRSPTKTCAT